MHTITNNYRDAHILNLGSSGERGPYLVTQRACRQKIPLQRRMSCYAPMDAGSISMLRLPGQAGSDRRDVFSTTTQIMETFGKLFGSTTSSRSAVD